MSDPTTGLPAAGWYGDPSDPSSERWWGGLEWTDHTRPLDAAPPAPATPQFPPPTGPAPAMQPPPPASALTTGGFGSQPAIAAAPAVPQFASQTSEVPQFASQTTSAIPQFSSQQPALPETPSAPFSPTQFTSVEEAAAAFGAAAAASSPPTGSWPTQGANPTGSPWETTAANSYTFGDAVPQFGAGASPYDAQPAAAWGASTPSSYQSEPQTNPIAIVGFVMSLLGFNVISLVLSILGVRKATRIEQEGGAPVGRILARWGIGLSIFSTVGLILWAGFFAFSAYVISESGVLDTLGSDTTTTEPTTPMVPAVPGENPVADEIAATMAGSMQTLYESEAQSVTCPADATNTAASVVSCDIVLVDGRALTGTQTFDAEGGYTTSYVEK